MYNYSFYGKILLSSRFPWGVLPVHNGGMMSRNQLRQALIAMVASFVAILFATSVASAKSNNDFPALITVQAPEQITLGTVAEYVVMVKNISKTALPAVRVVLPPVPVVKHNKPLLPGNIWAVRGLRPNRLVTLKVSMRIPRTAPRKEVNQYCPEFLLEVFSSAASASYLPCSAF